MFQEDPTQNPNQPLEGKEVEKEVTVGEFMTARQERLDHVEKINENLYQDDKTRSEGIRQIQEGGVLNVLRSQQLYLDTLIASAAYQDFVSTGRPETDWSSEETQSSFRKGILQGGVGKVTRLIKEDVESLESEWETKYGGKKRDELDEDEQYEEKGMRKNMDSLDSLVIEMEDFKPPQTT
jgi:hypothetical protein